MSIHLPNFLIAGAAKSGTSSLYYYLKGHPDIFLCPIKEPCFFSAQVLNLPHQGVGDERKPFIRTFEAYSALFAKAGSQKAIGEASADTLYYSSAVIPLLKQVLGMPRIIMLLRNPVDRAYSAYLHLVRDARETLSFEEGLVQEEDRIRQNWLSMWHYRNRGLYFRQVQDFLEAFGRDRVRVFLHDDLKCAALDVVKQTCEFLEVAADYQPPDINFRYNASGFPWSRRLNSIFLMRNSLQLGIRMLGSRLLTEAGWARFRESVRARLFVKSEMKPETRLYLQQVFREDLMRLQDLIERDISHWLA